MAKHGFDEEIERCIVCGDHDIREHIIDFRGIRISKCTICNFRFMNPQYSDEYLSEYYGNITYKTHEGCDYWHEPLLYGHDFYLSVIERFARPGKLLDIGCGNGYLLEAAMRRNWVVEGYDVDWKSTQAVSERLGINVHSGDFFSLHLSEDYDLVTMHQVLEHLKDPNRHLKRIRQLTKHGGYLFVAVPNIVSLSNRVQLFWEKIGLRKKKIGKYYDTNHHVAYFEPRTLTALLNNHGFKVLHRRNCHRVRPNQSKLRRFVMRNLTDHLFAKSAFMVIARKAEQ